MAFRPKAYGLTAEVNAKIARKYDQDMEKDSLRWLSEMMGDPQYFEGISGEAAVHEKLKDGVILCQVMNILQPGAIRKINQKKTPFLMMENIAAFLDACKGYGLGGSDLFQTVDLYEKQNMHNVNVTLHALGRKAQGKGFFGPILGPRESQQNVRQFSEETMREGRATIGLQMGSNKGATQSGMNFDSPQTIMEENSEPSGPS